MVKVVPATTVSPASTVNTVSFEIIFAETDYDFELNTFLHRVFVLSQISTTACRTRAKTMAFVWMETVNLLANAQLHGLVSFFFKT